MKQRIKSVGVLSVAKIFAAMYCAMGVLIAPLFVIVSLIGGLANKNSSPFGPLVGIIVALLIPFFYGGMGFVMGALSAFVYNLFAQWIGGIEIELQTPPLAESIMP